MVYHGPSAGCRTCRTRRVKCDERKPHCQRCLRLGYRCEGYQTSAPTPRFIDQTSNFRPKSHGRYQPAFLDRASSPKPPVICSLAHRDEDLAIPFFLRALVAPGRDFGSSRGLFELIEPALTVERHDSAVALAVRSVAIRILSLFRRQDEYTDVAERHLRLALRRIRSAIEDPAESRRDETVMAVLILQFHENLTAVQGQLRATSTHYEGAVALMNQNGSNGIRTQRQMCLLSHILHTEVSSALRGHRMPQVWPGCWDEMPDNASTRLDWIGASIANLRQYCTQVLALDPETKLEDESRDKILERAHSEAETIHAALMAWSCDLPYEWRPLAAPTSAIAGSSVPIYMGGCEIYPSVQVAAVWNLWRCYRLIVLKIILSCGEVRMQTLRPDHTTRVSAQNREYFQQFQQLMDSVCYSVPFHLGSRQTVPAISDMIDKSLKFPSYHDFDPADVNLPEHVRTGDFMSLQEHTSHVIMQGPWHVLVTLTHVLSLFSSEDNESCADISELEHMLRPGQLDWIREQVFRAAKLLNLKVSHTTGGGALGITADTAELNDSRPRCSPQSGTWVRGSSDRLVSRIREGLRFSSGS